MQGKCVPSFAMAFLMVGLINGLLLTTTDAQQAVTLSNRSFQFLCPTHIGGDREYAGHGPDVDITVDLELDNTNRDLLVNIFMHQKERRSDWSEAELQRSFLLFRAPQGQEITQIITETHSEHFYTDTNHDLDRALPSDNLVLRYEVMGDTGGNDIGNCTFDDAFLSVFFESIQIVVSEVARRPGEPCETTGIWDCDLRCVDADRARRWTGDTICDDGRWGMDLNCAAFAFDGGDCGN